MSHTLACFWSLRINIVSSVDTGPEICIEIGFYGFVVQYAKTNLGFQFCVPT